MTHRFARILLLAPQKEHYSLELLDTNSKSCNSHSKNDSERYGCGEPAETLATLLPLSILLLLNLGVPRNECHGATVSIGAIFEEYPDPAGRIDCHVLNGELRGCKKAWKA